MKKLGINLESFKGRILTGVSLLTLVSIIFGCAMYFFSRESDKLSERLLDVDYPAFKEIANIRSEIYAIDAIKNKYLVIEGADTTLYISSYNLTWESIINSLNELDKISKKWDDEEMVGKYLKLKSSIKNFKPVIDSQFHRKEEAMSNPSYQLLKKEGRVFIDALYKKVLSLESDYHFLLSDILNLYEAGNDYIIEPYHFQVQNKNKINAQIENITQLIDSNNNLLVLKGDFESLVAIIHQSIEERDKKTMITQFIIAEWVKESKSIFLEDLPFLHSTLEASIQKSMEDTKEKIFLLRLIVIAGIVVTIIIAGLSAKMTIRYILNLVDEVTTYLLKLVKGELPKKMAVPSNEMKPIVVATNTLVEDLGQLSDFAISVGEGDYDRVEITAFDKKGNLVESMTKMRDQIQENAIEESKRAWINKGLNIMNEIIHQDYTNIEGLCKKVLVELADYLNAGQAALFLVDDVESGKKTKLKMISSFAYGRIKYDEMYIEEGEGLVGETYLSNKEFYLENIPDNYASINSATGSAKPEAIFIVPISYDNTVSGVIEISSFNPLKDYERDFINKFVLNLANILHTVKVNETTKRLYKQSQDQAEQMRTQEEELRQNMEEMAATQEQQIRKEKEYHDKIAELKLQLEDQTNV